MKSKTLRELTPFLATLVLAITGYLCSRTEAEAKTLDNYSLSEESNEYSIKIFMGDNYEVLKLKDIESIDYSDDKTYVTIKMLDSNICYEGYFDEILKSYVFSKIDVKKFTKNNIL